MKLRIIDHFHLNMYRSQQNLDGLLVLSSVLFVNDLPGMVLIPHKRIFLRLPVCTTKSIPDGDVLAIIIVEIKVVHRVAPCTVDDL